MVVADTLSRYSPEDTPEILLDISVNHVYIIDRDVEMSRRISGVSSGEYLDKVSATTISSPGGMALPLPLVLTSSGGHQNSQYASYWNAFLLKILLVQW